MLNLFDLADGNDKNIEARVASDPTASAVLRELANRGHDPLVGVNMRPLVASQVLDGLGYLTLDEWAERRSYVSGETKEETLIRKLTQDGYQAKLAFFRAVSDAARLRYGSLNIGGMGPCGYGSFCMILKPDRLLSNSVAYLPDDSLSDRYFDWRTLAVRAGRLREDVAPHSRRLETVVIGRGSELHGTLHERWPGVVCSDDGYAEAVFLAPIRPESVAEIRVRRSDSTQWLKLARKESKDLSKDEITLLDIIGSILENVHKLGIRYVDDA